MRILVGNLIGALLGSFLFRIPVRESGENTEWNGVGVFLLVFVLLVSLYFQYLAISAERSGRVYAKGYIERDRSPMSFAIAQLIYCIGSSLLFVFLLWMLSQLV